MKVSQIETRNERDGLGRVVDMQLCYHTNCLLFGIQRSHGLLGLCGCK